jgi:RHS repeat-associated protein
LLTNGSFHLGQWYSLLLQVENGVLRARLWPQSQPEDGGQGEITGLPTGQSRAYRQRVQSGTGWLDAYLEGEIFSIDETRLDNQEQYNAIDGDGIPDLMLVYPQKNRDLKVVWSYPIETIRRTYDGLDWLGRRTRYEYLSADQYSSQYGNLTRQVEGHWNGTQWLDDTATKTQYWPRDDGTKYLVSLPGRKIMMNCPAGACDFGGESGLLGETLWLYDNNPGYSLPPDVGRLSKQRTLASAGQYLESGWNYDSYGNLMGSTSYSGYATATISPSSGARTVTSIYDTTYHTYLVSETNPLNQSTGYVYDYALGLPVKLTDPNGASQGAAYDKLGRMVRVCAPLDWDGMDCAAAATPTLKISYTDYNAGIPQNLLLEQLQSGTSYAQGLRFYGGLGQLIQSQTLGAQLAGGSGNVVVESFYDALGRVITQTVPTAYSGMPAFQTPNPNREGTATQYDLLGRTTSVTATDGSATQYFYSLQASGAEYWSQTITQAPRGNQTAQLADAYGRVRQVTPLGLSAPGVSYAYDPLGQLVGTNYGGAQTAIGYDLAGRKTSLNDADLGSWSYVYDGTSALVLQTDGRGCPTTLSYDNLGRLSGKTFSGTGVCAAPAIAYYYDNYTAFSGYTPESGYAIGQRTGMTDGTGKTIWEYDARGRLVKESKSVLDGSAVPAADLGTYVTRWGYTSADQLSWMIYPNGEIVNCTYLPQGALDQVGQYVVGSQYDEAGRLELRYLGNAVQVDYEYYDWDEQGGRLSGLKSGFPNVPTGVQNLEYNYDSNGNVMGILDTSNGATQMLSFGYDNLDRLTSAVATGGQGTYNQSYSYDPTSGNLASKAGVDYTYASPLHKHAVTGTSNGKSYGYDLNGNMTGHAGDQLTYDAENHLTQAVVWTATTRYVYDGDAQQVLVKNGSEWTLRIGNHFEVRYSTSIQPPTLPPPPANPCLSGSVTCFYLPITPNGVTIAGPPAQREWRSYYYAGTTRVAMRVQGGTLPAGGDAFYLLGDHLGSTSVTLREDGSKIGEMRYYPWGETRWESGTAQTAYKYTGQRLDNYINLYWYGSRWIDPSLGRFIQADSIVPDQYSPLDYDRYQYVHSNPLKYNDPTGHAQACADGDEGGGCGYGANSEQIYSSFDAEHGGVYDGAFAEYYANLNELNLHSYEFYKLTGFSYDAYKNGAICFNLSPEAQALIYEIQGLEGAAAASQQRGIVAIPQDDFGSYYLAVSSPGTVFSFSKSVVAGAGAIINNIWSNPIQPPGEGWIWRGTGGPGSSSGSWWNPATNEYLHYDPTHHGVPHYDYRAPDGTLYRIWPDGTMTPK